MTNEERYAQLQDLVRNQPDLRDKDVIRARRSDVYRWLGRLHALVEDKSVMDAVEIRTATRNLYTLGQEHAVGQIDGALHRALAAAEVELPASARGAFIPAGASFDAVTIVANVLSEAKTDVLFVDPYAGERLLSRFAATCPEGVSVQILTSAKKAKPSLKAAAEAWREQHPDRPLTIKALSGGVLHDRLIIIDRATVWNSSQSLDGIVGRASGSIVKSEGNLAIDQIEAMEELLAQATDWSG